MLKLNIQLFASRRPQRKKNGVMEDLELDAASLDGHKMEQTGISSNTNTIPTTAQVKAYIQVMSQQEFDDATNTTTPSGVSPFLNLIYPVGSIYMSVNSTSPATLFGGTWEQLKDRFLLGAGDTYTNGATGGEATHTLTIDEIPSHIHYGLIQGDNTPYGRADYGDTNCLKLSYGYGSSTPIGNYADHTGSTGGNQPHNNMPPYLVVYMWKRTA